MSVCWARLESVFPMNNRNVGSTPMLSVLEKRMAKLYLVCEIIYEFDHEHYYNECYLASGVNPVGAFTLEEFASDYADELNVKYYREHLIRLVDYVAAEGGRPLLEELRTQSKIFGIKFDYLDSQNFAEQIRVLSDPQVLQLIKSLNLWFYEVMEIPLYA